MRPSALGDVARTVPAAVSIKAGWPGCRLEWVVNRPFVDAVRHHPAVDEVIPFDRDSPGKVWGLMRELRRRKYDVVYALQGLARSGLLTWSTRAPRRVGFADAREGGWLGCNVRHRVERDKAAQSDDTWVVNRRGGNAVVIPERETPGAVWAVEKMLGLLAADGVPAVDDLRLSVGDSDVAWWSAWRNEQGMGNEPYAVIAPTAQWGCKCWPVERYAAVAEAVLREDLVERVVVVCSPVERDGVRSGFDTALDEPALRERVLWPDTTVGQLMAVIAGARLVVCNDSAALHLAVGLRVPTVSVFGPTDPALVGPWGYELAGGAVEGGAGPAEAASRRALGARHRVVRAPGAVDGAVDYRKRRDDDTLMRAVPMAAVWSVVAGQLG